MGEFVGEIEDVTHCMGSISNLLMRENGGEASRIGLWLLVTKIVATF